MLIAIEHPSENFISQDKLENFVSHFSDEQAKDLAMHVNDFKKVFGSLENAEQNYTAASISSHLMQKRSKALEDLSENLVVQLCQQSGYIVLKSFPIELDHDDVAIALFILGCYLGEPTYNNRDKKYIWPVISKQIASTKKFEDNIRYGNMMVPLPFHTDTSTFAGLLCLSPAQNGGENEIISTVAVHNNILATRSDLLETLYAPFYVDRRGEEQENDLPYAHLPVFGVSKTKELKTFWSDYYNYDAYTKYDIEPMSSLQEEAYTCLKENIEKVAKTRKITIKNQKGDLFILNNNLTLHSRRPFFIENYMERKLFRIWIRSDRYESFPHMFGYHT